MSRIDEAFKALEREAAARGVTAPEVRRSRSAERMTLEEYAAEAAPIGEVISLEARAREQRGPHEHRTVPYAHKVRSLPAGAVLHGDSHATLIGPATSPVDLEQYRRLAAALHDAQVERQLKTVMVTSAVPREGKTLTALNLALTLSDSYGRRVLVVDADLRRPSVHEMLRLSNTRGLNEVLNEQGIDLPLFEIAPNLSVLTAGRPGLQPLAGLTSERMGVLLDELETRFDWVLLDTPPVGFLPDARLLARLIRSVILVIAAGSTPAEVVERAVSEIGSECILGTVLNRVADEEISRAAYCYEGVDSATPVTVS